MIVELTIFLLMFVVVSVIIKKISSIYDVVSLEQVRLHNLETATRAPTSDELHQWYQLPSPERSLQDKEIEE